ncbi:hypothetical protein CARUB_v10018971mg [Capsella rubella]|uniref:F-box domain-containing protein n=1 Tax=Capsella rubella TaxID=81985 RepID=R0HNW0_9BRAS|nr:hypothetical protein CARUB_v10018971mg [Capsella rubella]
MLPHHIVEKILEKLPVKSIIKFKCVSKEWRLTTMSQYFKERHMRISERSHDPNILFVQSKRVQPIEVCVNTLTLRLSVFVESRSYYPFYDKFLIFVTKSCDGLLCIYGFTQCIYVINPSINWYRSLPLAMLQNLIQDIFNGGDGRSIDCPFLGLGRDKINGEYKLVWLYNSKELGLDNVTTCEVFSFNTNTWRNVTGSPYRVCYCDIPTYVDGSLHWLSEVYNSKSHIVSFDLYSETFEVSLNLPFSTVGLVAINDVNGRLCVSVAGKDMKQEIWSLNTSKKWEKTFSIDLNITSSLFGQSVAPTQIITTFQKNKIVLHRLEASGRTLMIHDPQQNSYDLAFKSKHSGFSIAYFPSLLTV